MSCLWNVLAMKYANFEMSCLWNGHVYEIWHLWNVLFMKWSCLWNMLSLKCPVYEMSCLWNVMSMKYANFEMSCLWNMLSLKCPVYEMSCIWNVMPMKYAIFEMSCLWDGHVYEIGNLWKVLSLKCPVYELFFYGRSEHQFFLVKNATLHILQLKNTVIWKFVLENFWLKHRKRNCN